MTTGDKIALERKKLNLTQEQLAYKLQVTRQAVSRWEADVAYPETEKLIKLSAIFGCTVDYLLNDKAEDSPLSHSETSGEGDKVGGETDERGSYGGAGSGKSGARFYGARYGMRLSDIYYEFKSERTVFGLPLVHINLGFGRTAKGFIAIGVKAKGVISLGILSLGVFALGVLSLGIFAFGAFALALLAAFGSVAAGVIAGGAVALGFVAFGAVAIGAFADGALALGGYVGVGDVAYGIVAIGKSAAHGEYAFTLKEQASISAMSAEIDAAINAAVPSAVNWLGYMCASFGKFMLGG